MSQEPEKKIIVDEDWKTQVDRERAAAEKSGAESGPAAAAPSGKPSPEIPLPPADLTYLVTMLSMQAMQVLGLMPDLATGKIEKNLPVAKHLIDLLEVLQQKTEGNRTPEESDDMEAILHQVRMAYVQSAGAK
jgi:hypothetical protein